MINIAYIGFNSHNIYFPTAAITYFESELQNSHSQILFNFTLIWYAPHASHHSSEQIRKKHDNDRLSPL